MLKFLFPRLHRERLNAAQLSSDLIDARGEHQKLLVEAVGYRSALQQVAAAASSVNTPNGTTRKILRIASEGLAA
jgi:hypothetical protein